MLANAHSRVLRALLLSFMLLSLVSAERSHFATASRLDPFLEHRETRYPSSKCAERFARYYDILESSPIISERHSFLVRDVSCKREVGFKVSLKIQELGASGKARHFGPIESSEVAVGFILNKLMARLFAKAVPVADLSLMEYHKVPYSKYVGFVRTFDFGYCSMQPVEARFMQEVTKLGISGASEFLPTGSLKISHLYLILERAQGYSVFDLLSTVPYLKRPPPKDFHNNKEWLKELGNRIRGKVDSLRSVLIQVLSTLWYASLVQFTHWDLSLKDILAFPGPQKTNWHFDIVQIDEINYEVEPENSFLKGPDYSQLYSNAGLPHTEASVAISRPHTPSEDSARPRGSSFTPSEASCDSSSVAMSSCTDSNICDLDLPVMRFRVPSSATGHLLFKISDFARSTAVNPETRDRHYSVYAHTNPFCDLFLLALELIPHIARMSSVTLTSPSKPLRINLSKDENAELSELAQDMLGWNYMSKELKQAVMNEMAKDLAITPGKVKNEIDNHNWLQLMSNALSAGLESQTSKYLQTNWIFKRRPFPVKRARLVNEFRRHVLRILSLDIFDKYRMTSPESL